MMKKNEDAPRTVPVSVRIPADLVTFIDTFEYPGAPFTRPSRNDRIVFALEMYRQHASGAPRTRPKMPAFVPGSETLEGGVEPEAPRKRARS